MLMMRAPAVHGRGRKQHHRICWRCTAPSKNLPQRHTERVRAAIHRLISTFRVRAGDRAGARITSISGTPATQRRRVGGVGGLRLWGFAKLRRPTAAPTEGARCAARFNGCRQCRRPPRETTSGAGSRNISVPRASGNVNAVQSHCGFRFSAPPSPRGSPLSVFLSSVVGLCSTSRGTVPTKPEFPSHTTHAPSPKTSNLSPQKPKTFPIGTLEFNAESFRRHAARDFGDCRPGDLVCSTDLKCKASKQGSRGFEFKKVAAGRLRGLRAAGEGRVGSQCMPNPSKTLIGTHWRTSALVWRLGWFWLDILVPKPEPKWAKVCRRGACIGSQLNSYYYYY